MFTVALIGPDGAGKTTVARQLEHALGAPVKYLYMGVSPGSSNVLLPTTRLAHAVKRARGAPQDTHGPPDPHRPRPRPKGKLRRAAYELRAGLRLANRLSEEWYRQGVAWWHQRRGRVVIFDRHFYLDFYAYDVARSAADRSLPRRVHGFVLEHLYPQPDLVLYLDAPGEVLFARKGEGTVVALERRRQDYQQLREHVRCFKVVDAALPLEQVVDQAAQAIRAFAQARAEGHGRPGHVSR